MSKRNKKGYSILIYNRSLYLVRWSLCMEHSSKVSWQGRRLDPFDCILDPNDWPFQYGVKFPERIPILEETCRSALATSLRKSVEPIFGEETEAPKSGKTRRRYKLNRIPDVYQVRTSYCLPKTMASTFSRFGQTS